jgi:uncharacterized RDD family membrane protein YckC
MGSTDTILGWKNGQTGSDLCRILAPGWKCFFGLFFRFLFFILFYFIFGHRFINDLGNSFYLLAYLLVELFPLKALGQTPGNMLMGIRVVQTDFSKLTWHKVFLRMFVTILFDFGKLASSLLIMCGTITVTYLLVQGNTSDYMYKEFMERLLFLARFWFFSEFIVLLTNRRKRGLQDYLAGTVVIKKPSESRPKVFLLGVFFVLSTAITVCFLFFWGASIVQIQAERGYPDSQRVLGELYLRGLGITQDYKQSILWYQKAADQGEEKAQEQLGEIYEKGLGVQKDQAQAIQWFTKAAKNGSLSAQEHLKKLGITFQKTDTN